MVMPGHEILDAYFAIGGKLGIDLGLGGVERCPRQFIELIEQLEQIVAVLFVEEQLEGMVVLEPQLRRRLVAEFDQLTQIRLHNATYSLAGFPDGTPPLRIFGILQDVANFTVGHFPAIHLSAEGVERFLDFVRQGHHLLQERRVDLFLQITEIEHVDLPGDDRIVDTAAGLDSLKLLESRRVGERFVDAVLRLFFSLEVFIFSRDIGVPPGLAGSYFQRAYLGHVGVDKLLGPRGCRGSGEGSNRHPDRHDCREREQCQQDKTQREHWLNSSERKHGSPPLPVKRVQKKELSHLGQNLATGAAFSSSDAYATADGASC